MIKTAIKNGWRAVTGWFSAMQDLSYSKASNEVGHLPTPDGIGGTWKTIQATGMETSFGDWTHNVVLNLGTSLYQSGGNIVSPLINVLSMLKSSTLLIMPQWRDNTATSFHPVTVNLLSQESANSSSSLQYSIPAKYIGIASYNADGKVVSFTTIPCSDALIASWTSELFTSGVQTEDPTATVLPEKGFFSHNMGETGDNSWFSVSSRGIFAKYLVATVTFFFKLYRSTTGWCMDGLASIESITSKSSQLVDSSVQMDTMTVSTYNQTGYEVEKDNINCPFIAVSNYTSSGSTGGVTTFELNKVMPTGTVVTVYVSAGAVASVDVTSGTITKTILIGHGAKFESCGNGTWFPIS